MTTLYLVRHGQTAWNLDGRYQGQADPPLNPTGWDQAQILAGELAGVAFRAVFSSDLQRAHDTACIIAERHGLPVHLEPELREVRLGAWEGMLAPDIQAQYADAWLERQRDPLHARPPGGESLAEVAERVGRAAARIVGLNPRGPLLLVSHGLSLAALICLARSLPLEGAYQYIPDNCKAEIVEWPPAPHAAAA